MGLSRPSVTSLAGHLAKNPEALVREVSKFVGDVDRNLVELVPGLEMVHASYRRSTAQAIAASTLTVFNFDTVDPDEEDTHSCVRTGAEWKFTAKRAGLYACEASVSLAALPDTKEAFGEWRKNWATVATFPARTKRRGSRVTGGGSGTFTVHAATKLWLDINDWVSFFVWQNSAGSLNTEALEDGNWVTITRLPVF